MVIRRTFQWAQSVVTLTPEINRASDTHGQCVKIAFCSSFMGPYVMYKNNGFCSPSWWSSMRSLQCHFEVYFPRGPENREINNYLPLYIYKSLSTLRSQRRDLCCWCHLTDIATYILQHYGWHRAALWKAQKRFVCREFGNAIEDIFSKSDAVTLTEKIYHTYWGDMPIDTIDFVLHRIRQRTRSEYILFLKNMVTKVELSISCQCFWTFRQQGKLQV